MNTNEHEGSGSPDASRVRGSRPEPRLSDREVPLGISRTPAHVADRIMAAIPQAAPSVTPWWRTRIELTPTVLGVMAASLLAVGLMIGMQLLK